MAKVGTLVHLRVYTSQRARWRGRSLYATLVAHARGRGLPGVTVLRGITGFGSSGRMPRPRLLEFFSDAPVLVEIVASEDQILALLADAEDLLKDELVILQPAEALTG
jgi:PII-like signaling protein